MSFFTNNQLSIERAIIATYIYLDFYCDILNPPKMQILDDDLFSTQYHRQIAKKINNAIQAKESISMSGFEMQDKTAGTRYESEWLEILASTPLPIQTIPSYLKLLQRIKIRNEYAR